MYKNYISLLSKASKESIKKEIELLELILDISEDERMEIFYCEDVETIKEYRNYLKNEFNAMVIFENLEE